MYPDGHSKMRMIADIVCLFVFGDAGGSSGARAAQNRSGALDASQGQTACTRGGRARARGI